MPALNCSCRIGIDSDPRLGVPWILPMSAHSAMRFGPPNPHPHELRMAASTHGRYSVCRPRPPHELVGSLLFRAHTRLRPGLTTCSSRLGLHDTRSCVSSRHHQHSMHNGQSTGAATRPPCNFLPAPRRCFLTRHVQDSVRSTVASRYVRYACIATGYPAFRVSHVRSSRSARDLLGRHPP